MTFGDDFRGMPAVRRVCWRPTLGREARPRPRTPRARRAPVASRRRARRQIRRRRSPRGSTSRSPAAGRSRPTGTSPTTASSTASRSRRSTTTWPAACGSRRWPTSSTAFAPRGGRTTTTRCSTADRPRVRAADPAAAVAPRLLRVRGPRPDDVGAPRRRGAGGLVPPADLLLQQRVGDPRAGRAGLGAGGIGGARLRAGGRRARRHAGPRPARRSAAEEAIGGYTIFNDWSARDLQRDETAVRLGPAKGKDFAIVDRAVARDAGRAGSARRGRRDRPGPRDDRRGQRRRDVARPLVGRPVLLRRDARPRVGGRPAAARRPARLGDGRRRLPARGPGRDARPVPRAGRRGRRSAIERLGELRTPIVARPAMSEAIDARRRSRRRPRSRLPTGSTRRASSSTSTSSRRTPARLAEASGGARHRPPAARQDPQERRARPAPARGGRRRDHRRDARRGRGDGRRRRSTTSSSPTRSGPTGPKADRLRALHDAAALRVGVDSVAGAGRLAAAVAGAVGAAARARRDRLRQRAGRGVADPGGAVEVAPAARDGGPRGRSASSRHGGHGYRAPEAPSRRGRRRGPIARARPPTRSAPTASRSSAISAGSTPTGVHAAAGQVNEIRAGTYVLGDRQQCRPRRRSRPTAARSPSRRRWSRSAVDGQIVLDAGAKTLTKDRAEFLDGFGVDRRPTRTPSSSGSTTTTRPSRSRAGAPAPRLGEVVAVVPNHVCPVVDQFDDFVVARGGVAEGRWPVDARGRSG